MICLRYLYCILLGAISTTCSFTTYWAQYTDAKLACCYSIVSVFPMPIYLSTRNKDSITT
jgi:hypothetical protein